MIKDHVLCIGDTHIPFEKKGYLDFCISIRDRVKCGTVVHLGDVVDMHATNFHEHDPDGYSPADEIKEAKKHLLAWKKSFKEMYICRGNHDRMIDRKARHVGLPSCVFKPFREIWDLPAGWKDDFSWELYNVIYEHGTGYSGDTAHMKAAYNNRQSTVIGHTHAHGAIGYIANEKECIFGMNCGSGVDRHRYAFEYGRAFKKKPIIGAGVVTDNGKYAQFFPMDL